MNRTLIPPLLVRWLWGSAAVHLVVVLILVGSNGRAGSRGPSETVLVTKLVRLGEKRPEELLPRKEPVAPTPAPIASPTVKPESSKTTVAPPKSPTAAERVAELGKMSNALERLKKAAAPAGDPEGSPEGEVSDISQAILGNKVASEVYRCIKRHWDVLGLAPQQVAGRTANVHLRINAEGRVLDAAIAQGSGLERFDAAVLRAVKMCGKISPPPKEILDRVRDDGFEVVFQP